MKTCTIEGCSRKHIARGWCHTHWSRWKSHGDPLSPGKYARYADPEEAFEVRTEPILWSGCLIWTGATDGNGYGQIRANGRTTSAHRYAWERAHGPTPGDLYVDHRYHCDLRCCEVTHLRLATPQQNSWNISGAEHGRDLPRGVCRLGSRYRAQVACDGKAYHLGMFDTPELASIAAQAKRAELFGEYAGAA